jgi:hypothetical protein
MARGQQDIAGFRRSHKKIPTSMAMQNDQAELSAKNKAVNKVKKTPNKVPLNNYSQFGQENAIGAAPTAPPARPEGGARDLAVNTIKAPISSVTASTSTEQKLDKFGNPIWSGEDEDIRVGTAGTDESTWSKRGTDMTKEELTSWQQEQKGEVQLDENGNIRQDLQDMWDRQNDQEAAQERIARQRASQEAMIRATMGAGEAGRSGAAALLQGEGGRMAESQARAAELERELGVAELGSALMNFDLAKDRYDVAEKRQAASAAMYIAQAYDVSYDEAFAMLGLPEHAKSEESKEVFTDWIAGFEDDDDDEDDDKDDDKKIKTKSEEIAEGLEEQYGDNTIGTATYDADKFKEYTYYYGETLVVDGRKIDLPNGAQPTGETQRFNDAEHAKYKYFDVNSNTTITVWVRE